MKKGKERSWVMVYNQKFSKLFYLHELLPSTLTSTSSKRPPGLLIIKEFGTWTGPGPFRETWGPVALPLTWTFIGHPGTGILLNETLMTCSHASAGTKETANLQKIQRIKNI